VVNVVASHASIALPAGNGIRPPLKWAGGKRWLVPHLRPLWNKHQHRRLVEPFCGGLAVALGLLPEEALLNDINDHAVNFYRQLKKGLRVTLVMQNEEAFYYEYRDKFNQLISTRKGNTKEAAELFYYLNRTGYNGLCRFNRKGEFNVPFGRYAALNYSKDFGPYKEVFSEWTFKCGDFEKISVQDDDFVYADPPYDVDFTQYSKEGFNWDDQVRLAEWLSQHRGPVVLSNQATDRVRALYKKLGFKITLYDAPRMISCTGDRTRTQEVLATRGL
jgi:DNA adenine methylase